MNHRRAWAIARKEFLHVLRDPRSLAMAIAMPMFLLLLYGYALTLDVDNVPMIVWDQSQTSASRDFISRFGGSRYFAIEGYGWNYKELDREIDSGDALVALVVPRDFADQVRSGRPASVQLIVDGSDSNTATLAVNYADAVTQAYSQALRLQEIRRQGGVALNSPIDYRPRVWFNPELESRYYIIPGQIAVIMMVIAALLTSLTVAREWERGTMEQLISTPVTGRELILGKLLPYFSIGMIDMVLAVLMGEFLFHVPLRGSVLLLFASSAIFLAGTMALGILISVVAKNQLLANQIAMVLTFVPSFLLSGFVFPISNMPTVIQWITYLVPARYFITLLKAIYLKGAGISVLAGDGLLLVVYAISMILLAVGIFKKKLV
ncbi:MAG TPA: ABC transporter permease [Terriglobia bacterium]|nr:ABC transporter permease [Terriglobia bacterium]